MRLMILLIGLAAGWFLMKNPTPPTELANLLAPPSKVKRDVASQKAQQAADNQPGSAAPANPFCQPFDGRMRICSTNPNERR